MKSIHRYFFQSHALPGKVEERLFRTKKNNGKAAGFHFIFQSKPIIFGCNVLGERHRTYVARMVSPLAGVALFFLQFCGQTKLKGSILSLSNRHLVIGNVSTGFYVDLPST